MKKLLLALLLSSQSFGLWIHPSMQEAIRKNSLHEAGRGEVDSDFIRQGGVKRFTGFKPTTDFYRGAKTIDIKVPDGWKPKQVDYQANSFSPVRRQNRGSCWAQGATSAFELNWNAILGSKLVFSVDDVIECSGFGTARGGGQLSLEYALNGLAYESDYPTDENDGTCMEDVDRHNPLKEVAFLRGANGGFPTEFELLYAGELYGALEVCGSAGSLGDGGRQDTIRGGGTNHCYAHANAIWGPDRGWAAAWYHRIKNSWGTSWGDKGWGYYRLAKEVGGKISGSTITEIQIGFAGPLVPPGPVEFTMESSQVSLKVVIAQGATYNEAAARKMLKGALDSLDKGE